MQPESGDVARLEVEREQILDRGTRGDAFFQFLRIFGRGGRAVRQGHAERFNGRRHGIGRVHAPARTRARAGVPHNVCAHFFRYLASNEFPEALERTDDIESFCPWLWPARMVPP